MKALSVLAYFPVLLTIYLFYFGAVTLAKKKDVRKIPYYGNLSDEEKIHVDLSRLILINSTILIIASILSIIVYVINIFLSFEGLITLSFVLIGFTILFYIIFITKIPLMMSKKK